jgi:hypothetical protein
MNTPSGGLVPSVQTMGSTKNAGSRRRSHQVKTTSTSLCVESDLPLEDLEDFIPYAIKLARTLKNAILVDQVPYQYQGKDELMQLLDEHITENIVKVETRYSSIRSIPNRATELDWGPILSASRWDPTRISPVLVTLFLLLWRSGASQI